jgi:hypothetical protein
MSRKNILFVSYGGGHVKMLSPVYQKLQQLGYQVDYFALTTAQAHLSSLSIPFLGFKDIPESSTPQVQAYGRKLTESLRAGSVDIKESIAYMGLSYQELVDTHGENEAARLYQLHGRQAFLPVQTLTRWIKQLEPDLVISTNSPRAERAAILAAGKLGMASVCVVDLLAVQEVAWIGQTGYADRVCVLNESVQQMFLERGRNPDEIVVTGNPAFDRLQSNEVKAAGLKLRTERGWNDGVITLLWAPQVETKNHPFVPGLVGDPNLPRKIEQVLRRFVQDNSGFRLVVRYHPSENIDFIVQEKVSLSPPSESLHELLHAVDGVITTASTVGVEASLIHKQVISVDCSIYTADLPLSAMGMALGVPSLELLPSMILEFHERGEFAGSSTSLDRSSPGESNRLSATEQVVNVVESLLY